MNKLYRIISLFLSAAFFVLLVVSIVSFKENDLAKIADTNLGVIINAFIDNYFIAFKFTAIPLFTSLSAILLVQTFYKDLENPLFLKMIFFSYIGLYPLFFILSVILLSTTPSDTTIVFTIFSYVGASILYVSTLYSKLNK